MSEAKEIKSGFVAIIGGANAGKSTLLNTILQEKVAIVSPKPQTTRENILGVLHEKDYQIAFFDTPGIFKGKTRLDSYMAKCVELATGSVSVVVLLIDSANGVSNRDITLIEKLTMEKTPLIIGLSKIDLIRKEELILQLERLSAYEGISALVPLSAHKKTNVQALISEIVKLLKDRQPYYGEDILTDKSEKYMIKEIIREKVLYRYNEEIPHGVMVYLNKFVFNEVKKIYEIDADIVCEKDSHKAIIIGKQGEALKHVATHSREAMERFLEQKVFLTLWVRVKEDWRNKNSFLNEFGYNEKDLT